MVIIGGDYRNIEDGGYIDVGPHKGTLGIAYIGGISQKKSYGFYRCKLS